MEETRGGSADGKRESGKMGEGQGGYGREGKRERGKEIVREREERGRGERKRDMKGIGRDRKRGRTIDWMLSSEFLKFCNSAQKRSVRSLPLLIIPFL